jgi:hypothetical protein
MAEFQFCPEPANFLLDYGGQFAIISELLTQFGQFRESR